MKRRLSIAHGVFFAILLLATGGPAPLRGQVVSKQFKLQSVTSGSALPPGNSVSHITVQDSALWIGSSKGVGKTTDAGRSWTAYRSDPAFADDGIFSVAANGDTVWASTGYEKDVSGGTVQTGTGYAYSKDAGATWQHSGQTLDQRGDSLLSYGINDSLWILPVVVPEQNVTFDISLSPGAVWIASWASGLRKSTDDGVTWRRVPLPADNRDALRPTDTLWSYSIYDTLRTRRIFQRYDPRFNNNYLAFAVYAQDNDTIWCGTAGGVNKSTDGGMSWVKFNHQNQAAPILGNWVISVEEQRFAGYRRLWTTNWRAEDPNEEFGVSYTDDGGRSWTNLLHGIRAYDFAFKDSIVYIAGDNGLYRTPDGGLTFTRISSIIDPATRQEITSSQYYSAGIIGDTVFVGTADGVASTVDNASNQFGASWKIYRTYQQVGNTPTTYAYPNPFSPAAQPVRIHYGMSGAGASQRSVSIDIFDFGMNRVRTLVNGALRSSASEYDELWNGRDDHGRLVANGVYFYRITTDNGEPLFGKILLLQ